MDFFYLRNITEIKDEYTTFLISIMTPFIYEGIKSVYSFAVNAHNEFIEKGKFDPDIKSPGVLKLFQLSLKEIQTLNNYSIEVETNRIKAGSKCAEWFDDLVRAVFKSNIVLLTFSSSKRYPDILKENFHEKVEIKNFVHQCYIESAKLIYNNPVLFWTEFSTLEIKRNQREACELIKQAIREAIRKLLPYKLILREYLQNDYYEEDDGFGNKVSDSKFMNIKSMVDRDLHGGNYINRDKIPVDNALVDEKTSEINKYRESVDDSESSSSDDNNSQTSVDYMVSNSDDSSSQETTVIEKVNNNGDGDDGDGDDGDDDNGDKVENVMDEPEKDAVKKENMPIEPSKPESQKVIAAPPIIHSGGNIPVAELDQEVNTLLQQSNTTNLNLLDNPKKKMNKREKLLMQEIEEQITRKDTADKLNKPDKKMFFDQYMK
jgi:hypothetical protein